MAERGRGTLFLVVGPSGAGKDSVIDGARTILEPLGHHLFPQRDITRPRDAGGEAHRAVSAATFAATRAEGGYALCWDPHGLSYGIDAGIAEELAAGRHVVCNVSRAVVDVARARFQPLRVLVITASRPVLAHRIHARGRESLAEIEARLARSAAPEPTGADVTVIRNDGALEAAIAAALQVLRAPTRERVIARSR